MMVETLQEPVLNTGAEQVPPPLALMQMLFGKHITYCVSAVARLGVADHMRSGPVDVERLAERTGSHAPSLTAFCAVSPASTCSKNRRARNLG